MNQTLTDIRERFSCRAFTGQMPAEEKLHAVLQAGIQSPSAMNAQPWQLAVLRNAGLLAEMEAEGMRMLAELPDKSTYERIQSRGGKLFYNAPCIIFVAADSAMDSAPLDCGIVCQSIAVAAQSLGLATCICGLASFSFEGDKAAYFKEKLAFPAGYELGMAVLLGEAAGPGTPHQPLPEKITIVD